MRCRIPAVTIRELRRVVFVGQIVLDDSPQKAGNVVQERSLKLANHQSRGGVLGEQANEPVLDPGPVHGFFHLRSDVDQLLLLGSVPHFLPLPVRNLIAVSAFVNLVQSTLF